tara:strand:- start:551 stop:1855 length:1305 start_codon:yes stop_codon:yes gene_type:complete
MTGNLISATKLVPTANSSSAYGVATGVWNLNDMYDYKRGGQWPIPAGVPGAPTISGVTGGNAQVAVAFGANADNGGLAVSSFTALASSGQSASATSSPITVTSLTNGTAITFTVTATNPAGTSAASSASSSVTPVNPPRGIFAGGSNQGGQITNIIQYITISSTGNAADFGDLNENLDRAGSGMCSSTTRALFCAGRDGSANNKRINYVTIASTGDAADFGDIDANAYHLAQCSNATRGIVAGGQGRLRVITYVTIASLGNAQDFNDAFESDKFDHVGTASPTRGVFVGSDNQEIRYVTIATTGSEADFGDVNIFDSSAGGPLTPQSTAAVSSSVRGCFAGDSDGSNNFIFYLTFASTGNGTDFGDLTNAGGRKAGASSSTRGCFAGGKYNGDTHNTIEYITIASTGNGADFGDLTNTRTAWMSPGSSDHGGLQ